MLYTASPTPFRCEDVLSCPVPMHNHGAGLLYQKVKFHKLDAGLLRSMQQSEAAGDTNEEDSNANCERVCNQSSAWMELKWSEQ